MNISFFLMKKFITFATVILSGVLSHAQDNNVVLSYNNVSVGWTHQSDLLGIDGYDANSLNLSLSLQSGSFIAGASVMPYGEADGDVDLFGLSVGAGYIYEVGESLHLIPSLSTSFLEGDEGDISAQYWSITPRITLNYAIADNFELSLGLAYSNSYDESIKVGSLHFDELNDFIDDDVIYPEIGFDYALSENLGLGFNAAFHDDTQAYGLRLSYNW